LRMNGPSCRIDLMATRWPFNGSASLSPYISNDVRLLNKSNHYWLYDPVTQRDVELLYRIRRIAEIVRILSIMSHWFVDGLEPSFH
jgi:hypothetical protein